MLDETLDKDFQRAEYSSVPVTLIILLFAFGALVAAGLPVLLGFTGVLATVGLSLVSHVVAAAMPTQSVILLVGMAVGVDYSLFYVRREREERAAARPRGPRCCAPPRTSGHAVLISGGRDDRDGRHAPHRQPDLHLDRASATMIMVAVALIGSLSVLPALLSGSATGSTGAASRSSGGASRGSESRFWSAFSTASCAGRGLGDLSRAALLSRSRLPALRCTRSCRASRICRARSRSSDLRRIQKAFPGAPTPANVVVKAPTSPRREVQSGIRAPQARGARDGADEAPIDIEVNPRRRSATSRSRSSATATTSVDRRVPKLRDDMIPATVGAVPGVDGAVTGETAGTHDFNTQMKSHAPLVFGFVLDSASCCCSSRSARS